MFYISRKGCTAKLERRKKKFNSIKLEIHTFFLLDQATFRNADKHMHSL